MRDDSPPPSPDPESGLPASSDPESAVPPALTEAERQRVEEAFAYGADRMTGQDLEQVLREPDAVEKRARRLGALFPDFLLLWGILNDYRKGDYCRVPWKFVSAIVFAVAYLIAPIDIIPDYIPFVGFVDDAAIFALVVRAFSTDIEAYKQWKEMHREDDKKGRV